MILDLSLGEFTALTGKAFRGVGYPWGLANDGAYAAGILAQHGLPAADIVARLLTAVDRNGFDSFMIDAAAQAGQVQVDQVAVDPGACPICLGVTLSDLGQLEADQFAAIVGTRPVLEPLLVAACLTNCRVDWDNGHAIIDPAGIRLVGAAPGTPTAITVTTLDGPTTNRAGATSQLLTRASVARPAFKKLLGLAARTYAPATEESRAGAGGDSV